MSNVREVYQSVVATLPRSEQLRLAALILQELSDAAAADLDYSDSWTEQDVAEVVAHASQHAAEAYPPEDDLAC